MAVWAPQLAEREACTRTIDWIIDRRHECSRLGCKLQIYTPVDNSGKENGMIWECWLFRSRVRNTDLHDSLGSEIRQELRVLAQEGKASWAAKKSRYPRSSANSVPRSRSLHQLTLIDLVQATPAREQHQSNIPKAPHYHTTTGGWNLNAFCDDLLTVLWQIFTPQFCDAFATEYKRLIFDTFVTFLSQNYDVDISVFCRKFMVSSLSYDNLQSHMVIPYCLALPSPPLRI
jgi:hypothetical protein